MPPRTGPGPAPRRRYYLIGRRGWYDVLRDVPMSTGSELEGILAQAQSSGLSVALLDPTFDVDLKEDLHRLRSIISGRDDLDATRKALAALDLLRERIASQTYELSLMG